MRTCLPILSVLALLSACSDGDSQIPTSSHSHSHETVSGIREGIWPPEPMNMEDEQIMTAKLRPRARQSVVDIARRSIMNNRELLAALGDNYATFDASLSGSKEDDVAIFVFYNYVTNRTIEATLASDGAVTVNSFPASEWQPAENAAEAEQAISLARASLEADNHSIDTLQATAMLTYPTQILAGDAVPNFYDSRILYVTFGNGNGAPPLYSARVDISTQVISEGGPL